MNPKRRNEVAQRMGPQRGFQYLKAITITAAEMLQRHADERWHRNANIITRKDKTCSTH